MSRLNFLTNHYCLLQRRLPLPSSIDAHKLVYLRRPFTFFWFLSICSLTFSTFIALFTFYYSIYFVICNFSFHLICNLVFKNLAFYIILASKRKHIASVFCLLYLHMWIWNEDIKQRASRSGKVTSNMTSRWVIW